MQKVDILLSCIVTTIIVFISIIIVLEFKEDAMLRIHKLTLRKLEDYLINLPTMMDT